jgi:hypothetical protein
MIFTGIDIEGIEKKGERHFSGESIVIGVSYFAL